MASARAQYTNPGKPQAQHTATNLLVLIGLLRIRQAVIRHQSCVLLAEE